MPSWIQQALSHPVLSRLRRNHALEHATIHVLSSRYPQTTLIGRADVHGFFLYGDLPTEAVHQAALDALSRLRSGERRLAIHPNCGTNFLTAGLLAAGASFAVLLGRQDEGWRARLARLPLAITLTILALVLAQPLGTAVQQRLTTDGDPRGLEIAAVERLARGRRTIHRLRTHG